MAGLRDFPLWVNVVLAAVVAGLVVGICLYTPGLPWQSQRQELNRVTTELERLKDELVRLRVIERQHSELKSRVQSLEKQLEVLRMVVPEEKEVDEFMRQVHAQAAGSGVEIRRITTKAVVTKEFHNELPFEIEFDGQYFAVLSFFEKLGKLSRIINLSDLNFTSLERFRQEKGKEKYPVRPGTTVIATATATTFFTKPPEPEEAAKAKRPGKQPAKGR